MQPIRAPAARRPWNPTVIAVVTLLFSPLVGGVLHGLNEGRLGLGGVRRFAVVRNLLAGALVILLVRAPRPSSGTTLFFPSGIPALAPALFFASYFYKTQAERFQGHLSSGGERGALIVPLVLSCLGALLVALLAFAVGFLLSE